jgi:antitoxin YefM
MWIRRQLVIRLTACGRAGSSCERNFTELRRNLAAELDSVINDAEEVVVTRSGHERSSLCRCEYESMEGDGVSLRNPNHAAALRRSIAELGRGDTAERDLIDPGSDQGEAPDRGVTYGEGRRSAGTFLGGGGAGATRIPRHPG